MGMYYFESSRGCGLRMAKSAPQAKSYIAREIGSLEHVTVVRKATKKDISWVKGMGGHVPDSEA